MHRRLFLTATPCLALPGLACATPTDAPTLPRYTVSAARLQQAVAQRFPLRYPLAGLLTIDLQSPRLRLLPAQNRLSAELVVEADGPALQARQSGSLEVDFALRYAPADRTIRAHDLVLQRLQVRGLQPAATELLNLYAPAWVRQSLLELVLHRFSAQDLALTDSLGLQPDSLTVTEQGLVIGFVRQPL
jgi:hypothetical protein